jgi:hypothetical protein
VCTGTISTKLYHWRPVASGTFTLYRVYLPATLHRARNCVCLTPENDVPDHLLVPEVGRYLDGKNAPVPPRFKSCWLALVGITRGDEIAATDRDFDNLARVAVQITERDAEGTVRVLVPPLKGRGHA